MQNLVGIIRTEDELEQALDELGELQERAGTRGRRGQPPVQPRLAPGARPATRMLTVSEAVTLAALERKESRGGHTRDDYPTPDPEFGKVNVRRAPAGGRR